jgi:hypothetical protein
MNLMFLFNLLNFKSCHIERNMTECRQRIHYIGPSFETMACTTINAAIVEYVPQPDDCALITADSMFMLDAGANYKFPPPKRISDCKGWYYGFHSDHTLWPANRL